KWVIERDDASNDPEWLADGVVEPVVVGWDRLAACLEREPCEVAKVCCANIDVSEELAVWTAVVCGVGSREFLAPPGHRIGEFVEAVRSVCGSGRTPARVGAARGADRRCDVLRTAARDASDQLSCCRIERVEGLAACGGQPLPT